MRRRVKQNAATQPSDKSSSAAENLGQYEHKKLPEEKMRLCVSIEHKQHQKCPSTYVNFIKLSNFYYTSLMHP